MNNKGFIPYESFTSLSKEFIDEGIFRTQSAIIALDLFLSYKNRKIKNEREYIESKNIIHIACRFAIMEIATIFDGKGRLSLKLHETQQGKLFPQEASFKKFFNFLSEESFLILYKRLKNHFENNQTLVKKILDTRHEKIAHAGISSYRKTKHLSQVRFPQKRFYLFAKILNKIFLDIAIGNYEGKEESAWFKLKAFAQKS